MEDRAARLWKMSSFRNNLSPFLLHLHHRYATTQLVYMHPTLKTIQLHEAIGWLSLLKGLNTLSGSGQLQITNQQELPPPNAPCCCMARL